MADIKLKTSELIYWDITVTYHSEGDYFNIYMDGKKVTKISGVKDSIEAIVEFGKLLEEDKIKY